ncbi:MAG: hypothetical protein IT350_17225 [Deltaproteobacteria bacterium]|nr:hypothetical protein [Deltaproteobacteria bacterium]
MADDAKTKGGSNGQAGGALPPRPRTDIYDPTVLRQVEAELRAEESGEPNPGGAIPIPELPAPPQHNPTLWLLRQIKRLVVILLAVWLVHAIWTRLFPPFDPGELPADSNTSVALPSSDPETQDVERDMRRALEDGRKSLASGDLDAGIETLEKLATDEPETSAGRKAMLTLAATYRFQKNDAQKAMTWYRAAVDAKPYNAESAQTFLRYGAYLEELARYPEAKEIYQRLVEEMPQRVREVEIAKQAIARVDAAKAPKN